MFSSLIFIKRWCIFLPTSDGIRRTTLTNKVAFFLPNGKRIKFLLILLPFIPPLPQWERREVVMVECIREMFWA
jgi:hypothetical protein